MKKSQNFIEFLQDFAVVWCWLCRILALWSFTNPTGSISESHFTPEFLVWRFLRIPQGISLPQVLAAMAAMSRQGRTWRGGWRWNRSAVPRRCASRSMRRSDACRRRPKMLKGTRGPEPWRIPLLMDYYIYIYTYSYIYILLYIILCMIWYDMILYYIYNI